MCDSLRIPYLTPPCGIVLQMTKYLHQEHHIISSPMGIGVGVFQTEMVHEIAQSVTAAPFGIHTQLREQGPADSQGVDADGRNLNELVAAKHSIQKTHVKG